MTIYRPPAGVDPSGHLPGGAAVILDPGGVWQVTCDTCGRFRRGYGVSELRVVEPDHIGVRTPDDTFAVSANGEHHFCAVCWRKRRHVRGLPELATVWWSRTEPRHIIKVLAAESMNVQVLTLYHISMISGRNKAINPGFHPRHIAAEHFFDIFAPPEQAVTAEELQRSSVWALIGDFAKTVTIRSLNWCGNIVPKEPFEHPGRGEFTVFERSFFLHNFVPLCGTIDRRTWHDRLIEDEFDHPV